MRILRLLVLSVAAFSVIAQAQTAAPNDGSAADDVIMTALKQELGRAKEKLQLGTQQKPYFIQYTVNDSDDYIFQSGFGAPVNRIRTRSRTLTVVVRVGDYANDSDLGSGMGLYEQLLVDDDVYALR